MTTAAALDLLCQDILQLHRRGRKGRDAVTQLVNGHLLLIELESELGFVIEVFLLLDVEAVGVVGLELGGDRVSAVVELFEESGLVSTSLVGHLRSPAG